ncbi:MAG: PqqD family protein [Candidatus Muiribacteriota bacterium]
MKNDRKVHSPDNILFTQTGDEIVLLDLVSGKYFSLNSTAADIYIMFVKEELTYGQVVEQLMTKYDNTNREQVEKDVDELISDLKKSGIFS